MRSCDTMVALGDATIHGQTLFAKNSDRPSGECQPLVQQERHLHSPSASAHCRFLQLPQVRETYRHVGSRPEWCWGYEHGFNEHQVVIGNEGLTSKLVGTEPKLIGMELLRLGLERSRTAAEAVDGMTALISDYGQGKFDSGSVVSYDNGYLIADPREAYVLETAGHEWAVKRVESTEGISNVYSIEADWDRISPKAQARASELGWNPFHGRLNFAAAFSQGEDRVVDSGHRRRTRACSVLKRHSGKIDVSTMISLLSDHSDGRNPEEAYRTDLNHQGGICYHSTPGKEEETGNTAASLVADLCGDGSRLAVYWCCFYSPCLGLFFPVFVEGDLPRILAVGDASLSDDSPWWGFHRLSRAVRRDPMRRIPEVRERWAAFQRRLEASAYPIAEEGRRLLDRDEKNEAASVLTRFMDESVSEMLSILGEMLHRYE